MGHKIEFKINQLLKQRGQSLYWLSRTTGVSYTTLWRFTKDRALGMNFATLEKLCVALECAPGDLIELRTKGQQDKKSKKMPARVMRRTATLL
jgi:putative transcriptional regulator